MNGHFVISALVLLFAQPAASEKPTIVPPMEVKLLTGEEYEIYKAKRAELRSTIESLEHEVQRKLKQGEDATSELTELAEKRHEYDLLTKVQDPGYLELMPFLRERAEIYDSLVMDPLLHWPMPLTEDGASFFMGELYAHDTGSLLMNAVIANSIIDCIGIGLRAEPPLSDQTRRIIRDGLVRYVLDGGGTADPGMELTIADALILTAPPDDLEARTLANQLYADAWLWVEELGNPLYENRMRRVATSLEKWNASQTSEMPAEVTSLSEALDNLAPDTTLARLAEVSHSILLFSADEKHRKRLLRKLLSAYKRLLLSKRTSDEIVKEIDSQLLAIAKSGKLNGRDWQYWAQAARGLGDRASAPFRTFITQQVETETDRIARRALRSTGIARTTSESKRAERP